MNSPKHAALECISSPIDATWLGGWEIPTIPKQPGRPPNWPIGNPPRRRQGIASEYGRRRFLHAIHTIELAAIDLACLCCLRAPDQPAGFHRDHLKIARDESRHAQLLREWLIQHDYPPGSEPSSMRLWQAALGSVDVGEQLVVIPRFLEARGLDVTAELLPRMAEVDQEATDILTIIYQEEIEHVTIGTRWHRHWCEQQGIDPSDHFCDVSSKYFSDQIPSPFELDRPGRTQAGFWPEEMDHLEGKTASNSEAHTKP